MERKAVSFSFTIRYDTIEEFNVDSKASTRSQNITCDNDSQ